MGTLRRLKIIHSIRYKLWINQADFDLKAAKLSLDNKFFEWTTYQSEQAVEKSFKSIILEAGFIPPKIHKLSILMGYCNDINSRFKTTKFYFRDIDAYTFISRYPFLLPSIKQAPHNQITKNDATKVFEQSKNIVHKVHDILEHKIHKSHELSYKKGSLGIKMDLDKRLQKAIDLLGNTFDIKKVVLFGSYARNHKVNDDKTIDLMIIANTNLKFIQRLITAKKVISGYRPIIEPLIYTPKEFDELMREGEGFLENAITEGRVLYTSEND